MFYCMFYFTCDRSLKSALWFQLLQVHRSGVDLLSANRCGLTGLHHAAALGHRRIVKYLVEQGQRLKIS